MAAAYSNDLRERVLQDAAQGLTTKALVERYHVSCSFVDALKLRYRTTGEIGPRVQTKVRTRVLEGQGARLQLIIAAQPDRTLREVQAALDTPASLTTIWRALNALDLSRKKHGLRDRTAPRGRRFGAAPMAGQSSGP
jgi:transposase